MDWQCHREGHGQLVLSCVGSLSWDVDDVLLLQVAAAVEGWPRPQVIVDLEAVDMVTSAGLGVLLQIDKRVHEGGGRCVIAGTSPAVMRIFQTVGLDRHITMVDSRQAAEALLQQAAFLTLAACCGNLMQRDTESSERAP